jgi:hypothetical protein
MAWMRRVWSNAGNAETVKYSARYPVTSGYELPDEFSPGKFKGLLVCQVAEDDDSKKQTSLLSVWQSKQAFLDQQRPFEDAINTRAAPQVGFERDVKLGDKSRWKNINFFYQFIVHGLAVMGTLAGVNAYYYSIFGRPRLTYVHPVTPVELVVRGPVKLSCTIRNIHSASSKCDIGIKGVQVASGEKHDKIEPDAIRITSSQAKDCPPLESGKDEVFEIEGVAQKPGDYSLVISVWQKLGLFTCGELVPVVIPVHVWSQATVRPRQAVLVELNGKRAMVQYTAEIGSACPNGIRGEAFLKGVPDVVLKQVEWPGATFQSIPVGLNNPEHRSKVEWTTRPEPAMVLRTFWLTLEASDRAHSQTEWEQIAKQLNLSDLEVIR